MPSSISSSEAESPGRRSFGQRVSTLRLPTAFAVSVALFATCEHLLWGYEPWLEFCARYAPPSHVSDPLRAEAWTRLLAPGAQPPIVLIGSSQILNGLECGPFRDRWPNRACRNLAVVGGTPLDALFVDSRVDRRVPRRVVVTGVTPNTLHKGPKTAFCDFETLSCLVRGGAWSRMSAGEWGRVAYGEILNLSESLRLKDSLKALWGAVESDPWAAIRFELPPRPLHIPDLAPRPDLDYLGQVMRQKDPTLEPGHFTGANEAALQALIEKERRRGNLLVVVDMPTRSGYDSVIPREALEHFRNLEARLVREPGVLFVARSALPPLEDADFYDYTHLLARGARRVSERLAEIVAEAEERAGGTVPPPKS